MTKTSRASRATAVLLSIALFWTAPGLQASAAAAMNVNALTTPEGTIAPLVIAPLTESVIADQESTPLALTRGASLTGVTTEGVVASKIEADQANRISPLIARSKNVGPILTNADSKHASDLRTAHWAAAHMLAAALSGPTRFALMADGGGPNRVPFSLDAAPVDATNAATSTQRRQPFVAANKRVD